LAAGRTPEGTERAPKASEVIKLCRTDEGFRASTQLYPDLWLRDLVFSEAPLLRLGYGETVRRHFEAFLRLQRKDGQLPTVITHGWRRLANQRYHFWTSDTELLFLIGTSRYAETAEGENFLDQHRGQLERCLSFVEKRRNKSGLIAGMDWRDALISYKDKFLLSNQMLLVDAFGAIGRREEAESVKETVREFYYSDDRGHFADFVWWDGSSPKREFRLDLLGNSLAILNGTASAKLAREVARRLEDGRSPFGYRNLFPPCAASRLSAFASPAAANAFVRTGAVLRNRAGQYQNSSIWPFVEARVVAALSRLGMTGEARRASGLILGHAGFNEWYSAETGEPRGSEGQLWTAAAVLEQAQAPNP